MKNYYIPLALLPLLIISSPMFAIATLTYSVISASPLGGSIDNWKGILASVATSACYLFFAEIIQFSILILAMTLINFIFWAKKYRVKGNLINTIRATSSVCILFSVFAFTYLLESSREDIIRYNESAITRIVIDDDNFQRSCEKIKISCEMKNNERKVYFDEVNNEIASTYDNYLSVFVSIVLFFWVIVSECVIWLHVNVFIRHRGFFNA